MNRVSEIERLVLDPQILQDVITRDVPMLSADWGVRDEDALVHTCGVNLFAGLGRAGGFAALTEFPVPRAEQWQKKLVRVDSAWFDRSTRRPVVLVEFERLSSQRAMEKMVNLCVAARATEEPPDVLLLCLWALDGERLETGWFDPDRPMTVRGGPAVCRPAESTCILTQAVFGRSSDQLHLVKLRRLA